MKTQTQLDWESVGNNYVAKVEGGQYIVVEYEGVYHTLFKFDQADYELQIDNPRELVHLTAAQLIAELHHAKGGFMPYSDWKECVEPLLHMDWPDGVYGINR
jgi:hypothetical protein